MKKFISLLTAAITAVVCLTGCSSASTAAATTKPIETAAAVTTAATEASTAATPTAAPVNLVVFAAASMTETLTKIGTAYMALHPDVTLTYDFDSSGTLKTQIQEGASCDIFISAGQKQMDQMDKSAAAAVNTEGLDLVLQGTRLNLLENKVVLVVPKTNPKNIKSFDDMAAGLKNGSILMAMGNRDVPVCQNTQKILTYYKLDEAALAKAGVLSYGTNVKEVTTQVSEGTVDCGVVYCTDAFSAGLTSVAEATKDMCGQVIYPAAIIKTTAHKDAAQAFLDYLKTDDSMTIFKNVGFTAVG
jgi:molybdate transport system substrate-binding protein